VSLEDEYAFERKDFKVGDCAAYLPTLMKKTAMKKIYFSVKVLVYLLERYSIILIIYNLLNDK
jgi:hypothetical protein